MRRRWIALALALAFAVLATLMLRDARGGVPGRAATVDDPEIVRDVPLEEVR